MSIVTYRDRSTVSFHITLDCTHPNVIIDECVDCGQYVGDDYGIQFGYIRKGLRLSREEVARLRDVESNRLFTQKKLHLVLDIDHTLVHSVAPKDLKPEEIAYFEESFESLKDCLVLRQSTGYVVKLRPFVRTFLKEASTMFEMSLNTRGQRGYALDIAQLLDPEGIYFGNRIIAREDSPCIKTLELVLGQKGAVLIVDDTESVWPRDGKNLIQVERYDYFAYKSYSSRRYSETGTDESETNGALAKMLRVLKAIHQIYFDQVSVDCRNVRLLVEALRSSILEGCILYFDCVDHEEVSPCICLMAKELGANLTAECNSSVTHLVLFEGRIKDICWAVKEKKFLVSPQWIEAAYYSWERQPEEEFPI